LQVGAQANAPIPQPRAVKSAPPRPGAEWVLLAFLLAVPLAATVWGLSYYSAPDAVRVRSPLAPVLRPSGSLGQSFGVAGLAMFLFMWLYPARKHFRALGFLGSVGTWMRVHIAIGIALPLLLAVHASWHFRGLIGLGYAAMLVVCASGFVGRYLYVRIPRARSGAEYSRDEITGQRRALITEIAVALALDPREIEETLDAAVAPGGAGGTGGLVRRLLTDDFARWRAVRELRRRWGGAGRAGETLERAALDRALRLARREIALAQRIRLLDGTHRLLGYWHVAHRPVALTALIAVLIHVAVAVATGQTWLR